MPKVFLFHSLLVREYRSGFPDEENIVKWQMAMGMVWPDFQIVDLYTVPMLLIF